MSLLATKIVIDYNELQSHIKSEVFEYVKNEIPPNCLLQAEHGMLVAHKIILSAASARLKEIFSAHVNESLIKIFVPGVKLIDLAALINLIYNGRIEVPAQQLPGILTAAHALKVPLPNFTTLTATKPDFCTILMNSTPAPSPTLSKSVLQIVTTAREMESESEKLENVEEIPGTSKQSEVVRKSESPAVLTRPKRNRKEKFKVSEVMTETSSQSPSPTSETTRKRKLTGKKQKSIVPNQKHFKCPHCSKVYAKTSVRHVVECPANPMRVIAHCPVCQAEVKPSGMSAHKKWHHR